MDFESGDLSSASSPNATTLSADNAARGTAYVFLFPNPAYECFAESQGDAGMVSPNSSTPVELQISLAGQPGSLPPEGNYSLAANPNALTPNTFSAAMLFYQASMGYNTAEQVSGGTVLLNAVSPDGCIQGTYNLTFPNSIEEGSFTANAAPNSCPDPSF